jgi:hypothetical protein
MRAREAKIYANTTRDVPREFTAEVKAASVTAASRIRMYTWSSMRQPP